MEKVSDNLDKGEVTILSSIGDVDGEVNFPPSNEVVYQEETQSAMMEVDGEVTPLPEDKCLDGEVSIISGLRDKKHTTEYLEWQLAQRDKNFKSAISGWRRQANAVQLLMSDSSDVSLLRHERDTLRDAMECISRDYELLEQSLSSLSRSGEAYNRYDALERDNHSMIKEITECIRDLNLEASEKSSSKSKKSVKSHSSRTSNNSNRFDIAAEAAALKAKLKFSEIETKLKAEIEQKKGEFEQVQTAKKLNMAEAKLHAIIETEKECSNVFDPIDLPSRGNNYVGEYCQSYAHDVGQVGTYDSPQYRQTVYTHDASQSRDFTAPKSTSPGLNVNANEFVSRPSPTYPTQNASQDIVTFAKCFADNLQLGRLPPPEPGVFTGDPLTYPGWKCAFETLIEKKGIPSTERIYYLKRYLGGPAREAAEGYFLIASGEAYDEAKQLLQDRYGDPFLIANEFRNKLESWPKLMSRDGIALRKLSDFLRQCLTAMKTIKSLEVLNDDRENQKILSKLPDWLVLRWVRVVADWKGKYGKFPPFCEFVNFVVKEANIACQPICCQSPRNNKVSNTERSHGRYEPKRSSGVSSFSVEAEQVHNDKKLSCFICKGSHHIDECKTFLSKTLLERKEYAKIKGLCFACLDRGHRSKHCRQRRKCGTCFKPHPTSLHGDRREADSKQSTRTKTHSGVSHLNNVGNYSKCSMIVPVWVSHRDSPESEKLVYALLDTQSDTTFILDETCQSLCLDGPPVKLSLSTMLSKDQLVNSRRINGLVVRGYDSHLKIPLPTAYSRGIMPANRSHIPTAEVARQWPHLQRIADQLMPLQEIEVGLLIGYNCSRALAPRDVIPPIGNEPYGQRTDLGWGIVGIIDPNMAEDDNDPIGTSHRILAKENGTNDYSQGIISVRTSIKEEINPETVIRMMELDFCERRSNEVASSQEDRMFLNHVSKSIRLQETNHYEMPLPFKDPSITLPNNKIMAIHRLKSLKRRLGQDEQYSRDYIAFMQNIIDGGHAELVSETELNDTGTIWYIPHHGIYHPKKPNKIRVVFDCSAKYKGVSLNDVLLQGPDMTNALVGVLCRFRMEPIAIMCDIEQMFFQFHVQEQHRDFLRFLWWPNGDIHQEAIEYRMKVHLFGAASSPGCANFGLKQTANDNEEEFGKAAADFVRNDFYVDDGLKSVSTVKEAIDLIELSTKLCAKGGLRLHKFISNSKEVIEAIPLADQAQGLKDLDLTFESLPIERALGVHWCVASDTFQFHITLQDRPFTRRGVLSTVSSVFDPLGFLAPVMLIGKQLLQQMCKDNTDWDTPLSDDLRSSWERWRNSLFRLKDIKIQRCFKPEGYGITETTELHHFSDASTTGYGQCSYLRQVDNNGRVHCTLVMGKSRVTPLRPVTFPRLELTAAVVSVKVGEFLTRELKLENATQFFWTDSKVVLGYITNDARRFQIFVANRVQQIRDASSPSQWNYVSTKENPADIASRGLDVDELVCESVWLNGPDFLWNYKVFMETNKKSTYPLIPDDPEIKKVKVAATQATIQPYEPERFDQFSNWFRLKRAIAVCLKVKNVLRARVSNEPGTARIAYKPVDVADLELAELEVIRIVQKQAFHDEIQVLKSMKASDTGCTDLRTRKKTLKQASTLYRLDPYLDDDDILRVGGRLNRSSLPIKSKNPAILPRHHHVSSLVVRYFHEKTCHQGRGMTTNAIRENGFWIVGCSSAVSQLIAKCVICRKLHSYVQEQKMADLPEDRIEPSPPFTYCAVDIFGPWYIKEGRKELKRYGVLFTCMSSRAVHIETANSMDTASFINALRRLISLRGPVRQLRSDCGTNFVGAERELQEAFEEIDQSRVGEFLLRESCDYIKFKRNVPAASHMGGVWERQIRTVRRVLSGLLREVGQQLDDECLRTLMHEAAATINSRPLTSDNLNDPTSLEPITPNNLLTMKSKLILPPPGEFQRADMYSRKRWRRVQHCANEFWHRWRKEYLQSLQPRQKWNKKQRNLQIGDLVLLKDDDVPRNRWRLARVHETSVDDDGQVRKVKIALSSSRLDAKGRRAHPVAFLDRPIQKLVLILEND